MHDSYQKAAELHDGAAHAHRVAEQHGKEEHLSGSESSRQALEHLQGGHESAQAATVGHGIAAFNHEDIAALAHQLWLQRGSPEGSPEEDWFHAVEALRSRSFAH